MDKIIGKDKYTKKFIHAHDFHAQTTCTKRGWLLLQMRIIKDVYVFIPTFMHEFLVHPIIGKLLHLRINPQVKNNFVTFRR